MFFEEGKTYKSLLYSDFIGQGTFTATHSVISPTGVRFAHGWYFSKKYPEIVAVTMDRDDWEEGWSLV